MHLINVDYIKYTSKYANIKYTSSIDKLINMM